MRYLTVAELLGHTILDRSLSSAIFSAGDVCPIKKLMLLESWVTTYLLTSQTTLDFVRYFVEFGCALCAIR